MSSSFDKLISQIRTWLEQPGREGRHFLETHLELLDSGSSHFLTTLITQYEGEQETVQELQNYLELLRDVQERGGTVEAVREAYVERYMFGGFVLDLPPWLEATELRIAEIYQGGYTGQTAVSYENLLRGAIVRAQNDASIAPETFAELQYHLGNVLAANPHGNRASAYEEAIVAYKTALHIYTLSRYPRPYAKCQLGLGPVYYERKQGERRTNLEQAIACYKAALQVYTREAFPIQWALTQYNLGVAYQDRIAGDLQDNMEEAIACYKAALQIYIRETFPIQWAMVQYNLGAVYGERSAGDQQTNMEQAIACSQAALQVYTRDAYPKEWATIQTNLGTAYYERIAGERRDNIEQAIQCYKAVLQVLTRDTFPAEWAKVQNELGKAYNGRIVGERRANVEQAIAYHEAALQILTRETFPRDWAWAHMGLGNAYQNRIKEEKRTNLERAISHHRLTLQIFIRDTFPKDWAMSQVNLGNAYQFRIDGERSANLEQAIACYTASLQIYTRETFPNEWAKIQNNLGSTYYDRIFSERRDNVEQAIQCSLTALEVHTQEDFPEEWAMAQLHLGNAYLDRIAGERRNNLEMAITSYEATLQVYKQETFPEAWAKIQHVLATAYGQRITGERQENLKRTIDYCQSALQVYTRETFPEEWAKTLNTLGNAYTEFFLGDRRENVEQAIQCCQSALQVYTREAFPEEWAKTLNGLGRAYRYRIAGDQQTNLEQSITCMEAALQVLTLNAFPSIWALIQRNLGEVYQNRIAGSRSDNLKRAVTCCQNALGIYTCDAFPSEHRQTQLLLMYAEAAQQNWPSVHNAYKGVRAAEELLVRLGAGAMGRDLILKEGRDAAISDGFALVRMGQVADAAVAIEQGRARGLAEALALDTADPDRISDMERRTRYKTARQHYIAAQASLNNTLLHIPSESERRRITQERSDAYHKAAEVFDAVIAEVRAAQDPPGFLDDTLDEATILHAAEDGGAGHALVYLAATPWGGIAIAALNAHPPLHTPAHFAELDLPNLTETVVDSLIEQKLDDKTQSVIGGFGYAQMGNMLELLQHQRVSETFRSRAMALHITCTAKGKRSMLDRAAQHVLNTPELTHFVEQPLGSLKPADKVSLANTLGHLFLQLELQHCLKVLAEAALSPLITWLLEQGATSLTLIPCGYLAAFPLAAVPLTDGRTVGETLPTSVALSARSLLYDEAADRQRTGLYAVGDPRPTHLELLWGEAEAHTLAKLARNLRWQGEAKVHERAVRPWLVKALQTGRIVDASCHGSFDATDFLQSSLQLARGERLTLAKALNCEVDLRGLRLLILSACQTAILDLRGASNEVRSLAAGMIQAGARAVLASLWSVDDKATYLLMVRFAQEWLPRMDHEPPAAALARAQHWLRTATNRDLQQWHANFPEPTVEERSEAGSEQSELSPWEKETPIQVGARQLVAVRGRGYRYETGEAEAILHELAQQGDSDAHPFEHPIYWAGFQITGW